MEKSKNIKYNFLKFINTGIIGPLISFGAITSIILIVALQYGISNK